MEFPHLRVCLENSFANMVGQGRVAYCEYGSSIIAGNGGSVVQEAQSCVSY